MNEDERTMRQAFIRHLVANIQCVSCGERYARNDIYVLGHHEDIWVSAVVCSRCGTQGLVFATLRGEEEFRVASESAVDELAAMRELPAFSIDDVLNMHEFLRDFHGDVNALFREGRHQDA